ncbi:MAG: TIGR03915 family putative DNA repair protein [Leeuwenhoekiella sp.]
MRLHNKNKNSNNNKAAHLVYDGSFEGLLSAVFVAYEEKVQPLTITTEIHALPDFFNETIEVFTDETKAERVWKGLSKYSTFRQQCYRSFLTEIPESGLVIFQAIRYVLQTGNDKDYGEKNVLQLAQWTKMVGRERHRMEAFVRFQLTKDGIYFAQIEPDFNVLPVLEKHFKSRYADQRWIVYDLKRGYGLYYDLTTVTVMTLDLSENKSSTENIFAEAEADYSALWQNYFKSSNIKSRINLKLHTRHVPKRYWKYLNEKLPDYSTRKK